MSSTRYYILEGHAPKRVSYQKLLQWDDGDNRHVATTKVGSVVISTVFLEEDHAHMEGSEPVLFETKIFGGDCDHYSQRYCTWDEAEAGHAECVEAVKSGQCKQWLD